MGSGIIHIHAQTNGLDFKPVIGGVVTPVVDWSGYYRWREAFAGAIDARFYPMTWLDRGVQTGRARFWCCDSAAILATVKAYPSGLREVHGMVAAGDLAGIAALIPLAEGWGRKVGCEVASIASRGGWARALRGSGYAVRHVEVRRVLP